MRTAEDIIKEKKRDMVFVSSDQTIREALQVMVSRKIGAILVKENDKIVGIWTERDLMQNIIAPGFKCENARIGDYMTTQLHTAPHDTPIIKLQEMFLGLFVRHLLVTKNQDHIGLLSIGDVVRVSLLEKDKQIKELNAMVSWEYYENWGWDRKNR
jgi:signal-transduction protein with cAMP-binding, CBS, and nucleotidyltransferase domain